ncbi:hypothetical protein SAMN06295943_2806 [Agreia sp. VKM Ac-1783]|nr:hypothetical protein SAMN06295943_2806 [Agreia sp. VKM Ac-1783]
MLEPCRTGSGGPHILTTAFIVFGSRPIARPIAFNDSRCSYSSWARAISLLLNGWTPSAIPRCFKCFATVLRCTPCRFCSSYTEPPALYSLTSWSIKAGESCFTWFRVGCSSRTDFAKIRVYSGLRAKLNRGRACFLMFASTSLWSTKGLSLEYGVESTQVICRSSVGANRRRVRPQPLSILSKIREAGRDLILLPQVDCPGSNSCLFRSWSSSRGLPAVCKSYSPRCQFRRCLPQRH